jgi:hypothetical protein
VPQGIGPTKIIIDDNLLQKNLLLKRKYGEVVGNVIQERKRRVSSNRLIGDK